MFMRSGDAGGNEHAPDEDRVVRPAGPQVRAAARLSRLRRPARASRREGRAVGPMMRSGPSSAPGHDLSGPQHPWRMSCRAARDAGVPVAGGTVEAANKTLVGVRMTRPSDPLGAGWGCAGGTGGPRGGLVEGWRRCGPGRGGVPGNVNESQPWESHSRISLGRCEARNGDTDCMNQFIALQGGTAPSPGKPSGSCRLTHGPNPELVACDASAMGLSCGKRPAIAFAL